MVLLISRPVFCWLLRQLWEAVFAIDFLWRLTAAWSLGSLHELQDLDHLGTQCSNNESTIVLELLQLRERLAKTA